MKKEIKPKKKSLAARIGIKLFKKVIFFTSKSQVDDLKAKKTEEIKLYAEAIKEILRPKEIAYDNTPRVSMIEGNKDVYFYDFLKEWNNNGTITAGGMMAMGRQDGGDAIEADFDGNDANILPVLAIDEDIEKVEPRLKLKPIEVFAELERIPTPISLENLEEKILMFKMKEKLIVSNHYSKKEVIDFGIRLENRRKYNDHKEFFEKFECTTSEKINKLISKYDLVLKTTDLFIATFPDEAISAMNDCVEHTMILCNKKPVFYVIAEAEDFKKEYEKKDPILLVQSPFGIYWYILGAWDKEILLLEEL